MRHAFLRNWLSRPTTATAPRCPSAARLRPACEALEGRALLARWLGNAPVGDAAAWSNPLNWAGEQVPGPGDTAIFDGSARLFNSTVDRPFAIAGVNIAPSWPQGGGINIGNAFNSSSLTLTGTSHIAIGTFGGHGHLINNGTLTLAGGQLNVNAGSNSINNGTLIQTGGLLAIDRGTLTNRPGAVYDVRTDGTFITGNNEFVNAGTLRKSDGAGTSAMLLQFGSPNFTNAGGTIDVRTGTLLDGSVSAYNGGTIAVATGAVYELRTAGTLTGTLSGTGGGTVRLGGGDFFRAGAGGGVLNFPSDMLQWTGGILDGDAAGLTNAGFLAVAGNADLRGSFRNTGTITQVGTATLSISGNVQNTGTIIQASAGPGLIGSVFLSGALTNQPGAIYDLRSDQGIFSGGTFVNAGTFRKTAGTETSRLEVSFNNPGTVEARAGTLAVGATDQLQCPVQDATLAGGAWHVFEGATLNLPLGSCRLTTSNGNVSLSGPSATFVGLADLARNGGSFTVQDGHYFTTVGALTNTGSVTVLGADSGLLVSGNYTQTAGITTLREGLLFADTTVEIQGGVLAGSGSIVGHVVNAGQLHVGGVGAAGWLYIFGNYTQTAAGRLDLEIGGGEPGSRYDYLFIEGTATLDGALRIALIEDFLPNLDDVFSMMNFTARSGDFATYNGQDISEDRAFFPFFDDYGLYLLTIGL